MNGNKAGQEVIPNLQREQEDGSSGVEMRTGKVLQQLEGLEMLLPEPIRLRECSQFQEQARLYVQVTLKEVSASDEFDYAEQNDSGSHRHRNVCLSQWATSENPREPASCCPV